MEDDGLWYDVDNAINDSIEYCDVGGSTSYNLGKFSYNLKKLSDDYSVQTNISTKKTRDLRAIVSDKNSQKRIIWEFLGNNNIWYPMDSCELILRILAAKANQVLTYKHGKYTYNVKKNFDGKTGIQTNTKTKKQRKLRMVIRDSNVSDDDFKSDILTGLHKIPPNMSQKSVVNPKKNIKPKQKRFTMYDKHVQKMITLFRDTMHGTDVKQLKLHQIPDHQSRKAVYDAIVNGKSHNNNNINNCGNEEQILFHGTSKDSIDKIVSNGFNRDFNVKHVYGKGVYFAKYASKSFKFCQRHTDGYYYMLICRVYVGDYTVGKPDMDTPPLKNDGLTQYDSLVNDINNPTIFVVSKDYHAIPEYIVTFNL